MKPVHAITPPAGTLCGTDPYGTITEDPKAVTCPVCRSKGGGDPPAAEPEQQPVHLTTDQGYTIACRRDQPRTTIDPLPAIVELADHELITCPDCTAIAIERAKEQIRAATAPKDAATRSAAAAERIAVALERIAEVAETLGDFHRLADILTLALSRSR